MKILLDLNIYLDIAIRKNQFISSYNLLKKLLSEHRYETYLASCSYTTLYYLLTKAIGKDSSLAFIDLLLDSGVRILTFSLSEIELAKKLKFKDHEDACVCATAINNSCDLILTRNIVDFKFSPIKTFSPEQFLKKL